MHVAVKRVRRAGWLAGVWADTGISTGRVADEDAPVGQEFTDR